MGKDLLALCILLLWASAGYAAREVIVVGAGASGLAAARELANDESVKVTILEARASRYGGRIWTNTESFVNATGPEVDMGASYIHQASEDNSVVQLFQEFKIPVLDLNPSTIDIVREKDQVMYGADRLEPAVIQVDQAINAAVEYAKTQGTESSIRSALWKSGNAQKIGNPLSQLCLSWKEFWIGAPIDNTSAAMYHVGFDETITIPKIPSTGYTQMLDMLVQKNASDTPLDIRLGQVVKQITVLDNKRVSVTCKDGRKYEADAVIVTLPLGVLKANTVKFTPKLPKPKLKAIRRIGFGVVNKIILQFDRVFWPKDRYGFGIAMKNMTKRGDFSVFVNFYAVNARPVLVSYAVGYFGKASEKLSDRELKRLALRQLRTFFGNEMDTVKVVKMARTRWLADPFSRGSYSFPAVGVMADDWDTVGKPEEPLFFAGEHTRTKHYGTVETAIDTGRRAASQTMQYFDTLSQAQATTISLSHTIILTILLMYCLL